MSYPRKLHILIIEDETDPTDDCRDVLRAHAEKSSLAALRFDTELTAFEQDADGVTVTLVDRVGGTETRVRTQYVIAADGAQSRIRRALGVTMVGKEDVYDSVNVLLNADLRPWTEDRIDHDNLRREGDAAHHSCPRRSRKK